MVDKVKTFIEDNIELFNDYKFDEIFDKLSHSNDLGGETWCRHLFDVLSAAIPDFLLYMSFLPPVGFKVTGEFKIPKNIKSIVPYAFADSKVSDVYIPDSITVIPRFAFQHCFALNRVFIPKSVTHIEEFVFSQAPFVRIHYEGKKKPRKWSKHMSLEDDRIIFEDYVYAN